MINTNALKVLTCECGTKVCFECGAEAHPEKTCAEIMDETYKDYAKKKYVQLCKNCKSRVEKDEGCNHMVCP